jgi:hypothetical protein
VGFAVALTALVAYLRVIIEWPNYTDYGRIAFPLGLP